MLSFLFIGFPGTNKKKYSFLIPERFLNLCYKNIIIIIPSSTNFEDSCEMRERN